MIVSVALLLPWAVGAVLLLADGRRRWAGRLAVAVLVATLALLAVLAGQVLTGGDREVLTGGWPAGVGIVLRADVLGVVFALLSLLVLLAAVAHEVLAGVRERAFPALVLLLAGGLSGLFLTGDIFSFYVFFELAMTASYVLATYGGGPRQLRGALVFTAVNLLGSFIFLLSVAGTYRVTGTLAMDQVAARMAGVDANAAILVATGFFVAFSIKLGLFPFHFWLPTVYSGSRPAVAAILGGAVANIGAYGMLRFGPGIFPAQLQLAATALVVLGGISLVYGAVLAVGRADAGESLAYSAIGQVGYVMVAVGVGGTVGLTAAVLYSAVNALNKALLFLSAGVRGPLVGAAFAVGALSVAGVPPAAGFVGKLEMLRAGILTGSVALVVLLVAGSALSLVYMFQLYQHRFWRADPAAEPEPSRLPVRLPTAGLAALVLAAGLWPEPLLAISARAADGLLAGGLG